MKALLLLLTASWVGSSSLAVTYVQATVANPEVARRFLGTSDGISVWLSNMADGRVVSRAPLRGGRFRLAVPDAPPGKLRPYDVCDGVRVRSNGRLRTYTPETVMLYSRAANRAIGPVIQANDARTPTKTTAYVYANVAAVVRGRCSLLNVEYDLELRRGWNVVMNIQGQGARRFRITNARETLPFWIVGDLKLQNVSRVLPKSFFKDL